MTTEPPSPPSAPAPSSATLAPLAALAVAIMLPVTLPVPVLRGLVQERFAVSELLTSLFMSINMIGGLFAAPLAGLLLDRFGRARRLLVGALLLDALCFAALTAEIPFALFLALRFVEGCAHISALSVLLALAAHARPEAQRGRALGLVGGSMMLGVALGAPLGGALGRANALVPLEVGAVLLLVAALLAAFAAAERGAREAKPGFAAIRAALREHPLILVPLLFAFADRFTVGFFTTTFSLYAGRIHGASPAQIGALIAIFMLPFALLSYPFGRFAEQRSAFALTCGGSLLYGIGTAAVGFVAPPALFGLMLAIGFTAAVMFVPSMLLTVQLAPAAARATALGAFNAAGSLGFIAGPLVGGLVTQQVAAGGDWASGYRAAFLVAGASELLCVLIALPFLPALRRRRG